MSQPVTRFQNGSVKVSVWQNQGKKGAYYSIRVERSYKDPVSGEWKNSNNFFPSELPHLNAMLQRVGAFLENPEKPELPEDRAQGRRSFAGSASTKGGSDDSIL